MDPITTWRREAPSPSLHPSEVGGLVFLPLLETTLSGVDETPHLLDASKPRMKWVGFLGRQGGVLANKREGCSSLSWVFHVLQGHLAW